MLFVRGIELSKPPENLVDVAIANFESEKGPVQETLGLCDLVMASQVFRMQPINSGGNNNLHLINIPDIIATMATEDKLARGPRNPHPLRQNANVTLWRHLLLDIRKKI